MSLDPQSVKKMTEPNCSVEGFCEELFQQKKITLISGLLPEITNIEAVPSGTLLPTFRRKSYLHIKSISSPDPEDGPSRSLRDVGASVLIG